MRTHQSNIIFFLCFVVVITSYATSPNRAMTADVPSPATQSSPTRPLTREELEQQVQAKAKALEEINKQLETTQQNLKSTQQQRVGLQRELTTLQGNINQLTLSIKADEITIQKLGLEVQSLGYDLADIRSSTEDKQKAIGQLLKELQKMDQSNGNLLVVFLKNKSLADGVFETQALSDLQSQLALDMVNLRELHDEYNKKIELATDKKGKIDFHQQNLKDRKFIVEDQKQERESVLTQTKNKESVFTQQVNDLKKQQQQIADEVEALDAVLRTKIDPSLLPPPGPGVLAMPVQGATRGTMTQNYGATAFAQSAYRGRWHNGVDFGGSIGTPVLAAEDGVVVATGNQDAYCYKGAYGRFIVMNHNNNLSTLYAHLSRQVVKQGDTVQRGNLIGYVGRTGYATGPHLHFTVFAKPTFYMGPSKSCGQMPYGGDLNPSSYL